MFHDTYFNENNLKIFLRWRFHLIPSDPFIWPIVQCLVNTVKLLCNNDISCVLKNEQERMILYIGPMSVQVFPSQHVSLTIFLNGAVKY